eukprot:scaffold3060_cov121-Isochrysis_galbana.AAC.7
MTSPRAGGRLLSVTLSMRKLSPGSNVGTIDGDPTYLRGTVLHVGKEAGCQPASSSQADGTWNQPPTGEGPRPPPAQLLGRMPVARAGPCCRPCRFLALESVECEMSVKTGHA